MRGEAGGVDTAPTEDGGGYPGRARVRQIAARSWRQGKDLSILRFHHVGQEVGGGGGRSVGSKPPDCVRARRAASASALAPTVTALSLLFRDVLRLL